jgi:hypothetical protein
LTFNLKPATLVIVKKGGEINETTTTIIKNSR